MRNKKKRKKENKTKSEKKKMKNKRKKKTRTGRRIKGRERNDRGSRSAPVLPVLLTFSSRKCTIYMLQSIRIHVGVLR